MKRFSGLIFLLMLCSCGDKVQVDAPIPENNTGLTLQSALGGDAAEGFLRAIEPRVFSFPQDHNLHEGFRNEWWYLTGNLFTASGRRFGYQLTFFAVALTPEQVSSALSEWQSNRIWMAHFALTDVDNNKHYAFERFSRENPGLAGNQNTPFKVWLEDWFLQSEKSASTFPWRLSAGEGGLSLSLSLETQKPEVLQGDEGLSRKSEEAGNASYYYSLTRMPSIGQIEIDGVVLEVSGTSWLDREWSTSALDAEQSGWDWFSLQLDDGQELMYYQLRTDSGGVHPSSAGNWTDQFANQQAISPEQINLVALREWQSPTGKQYSTSWQLQIADKDWRVEAVLEDQYMDVSLAYWEGAVDVIDQSSGAVVGHGYLEMVR